MRSRVEVGDSVTFTVGSDEPHSVTFGVGPEDVAARPVAGDRLGSAPAGTSRRRLSTWATPTYDGTSFLNTGLLWKGSTATAIFTTPGSYVFTCVIHPGMYGEVDVVEAGAGGATTQAEADAAGGRHGRGAAEPGGAVRAARLGGRRDHRERRWHHDLEHLRGCLDRARRTCPAAAPATSSCTRCCRPASTIGVGDTVHWSANGAHTVTFPATGQDPDDHRPVRARRRAATSTTAPASTAPGCSTPVRGRRPRTRSPSPLRATFPYVCALHQFLGQRGVIAVGQPLPSAAAGSPRGPRHLPPARRADAPGATRPHHRSDDRLAGSDAGQSPYTRPVIRTVRAVRYATPLREGGSLPAVIEADDGDEYVVKFRGAGQGPGALIAEVVAGSIAPPLGLAGARDRARGPGARLWPGRARPGDPGAPGAQPGPQCRPPVPAPRPALPAGRQRATRRGDAAAAIVWLDALVTNIDRTPRNPNLLTWQGGLWLIDHGAALYVQHTWRDPDAHARRPFPQAADHVLLPYAGSLVDADARLAPLLDATRSWSDVLDQVPDDWLSVPARAVRDDTCPSASRRPAHSWQAAEAERTRRRSPPDHGVPAATARRHVRCLRASSSSTRSCASCPTWSAASG